MFMWMEKVYFMHMLEILLLTVDPHKLSVLSLCVQRKKLKPLTAYDQFESYVLAVVVQVSGEMTVDVFCLWNRLRYYTKTHFVHVQTRLQAGPVLQIIPQGRQRAI